MCASGNSTLTLIESATISFLSVTYDAIKVTDGVICEVTLKVKLDINLSLSIRDTVRENSTEPRQIACCKVSKGKLKR